jgi:hypothetical protein
MLAALLPTPRPKEQFQHRVSGPLRFRRPAPDQNRFKENRSSAAPRRCGVGRRLDTIAITTFEDDAHGTPSRLTRRDAKVATLELRQPDLQDGLPLLTKTSSNDHFATVVMPHLDDAYALARWLSGNSADAEDIVQEACLRALRGLDRYAGGNARAWLLAITRNTTFTWLARNRPKTLVIAEDIEALALGRSDAGRSLDRQGRGRGD